MKIKFSKSIDKERLRGRAVIDRFFVPELSRVLGDKHALYAAKHGAAIAHLAGSTSALIEDNAEANEIISRYTASLDALAGIERQRQALQARIDACQSAAEIDALLEKVLHSS